MTARGKFTANFYGKIALEALPGDRRIQEIASRHKKPPNQVRKWKRQAMEGLGVVYLNGPEGLGRKVKRINL